MWRESISNVNVGLEVTDHNGFSSTSIGGVGIVFQPLDANNLIVKGLRPDSQAAMSGLVQIGDRLIAVNELQVMRPILLHF